MQYVITPIEFQELIKNKCIALQLEKVGNSLSKMVLPIIIGYSAALRVIKTQHAGTVSILLN